MSWKINCVVENQLCRGKSIVSWKINCVVENQLCRGKFGGKKERKKRRVNCLC
jgi:hypothetical protein